MSEDDNKQGEEVAKPSKSESSPSSPADQPAVNSEATPKKKGIMAATLSWRCAAANALAFSFSMLICLLLILVGTILFLPAAWIRDNGWDVSEAFIRYVWIIKFSLMLCPLVFVINLLLRKDEEVVKKKIIRMECWGTLCAIILSACYFWPGWLR